MKNVDIRVKLSTLWVCTMFNMAFADILSFTNPDFLKEVLAGTAGGVQITPGFLLLAAIILEIPIAMIFLSRILAYQANRWANIIAAIISILFVIGGGAASPHYIFIAAIEVITLLAIIRYAWKWPLAESLP